MSSEWRCALFRTRRATHRPNFDGAGADATEITQAGGDDIYL